MTPNQTPPAPGDADFSHADVRAALEKIVASRHFSASRQLQAFLRFVVERKLAGDEARLKEYTIGTEVLSRGADFDPKVDGVVRVQAGLLRKKLAAYQAAEGREDAIAIDVPKGAYVPVFRRAESPSPVLNWADRETGVLEAGRARNVRRLVVAVVAMDAILVSGLVAFFALRDSRAREEAAAPGPVAAAVTPAPLPAPVPAPSPSPWDGFFAGPASTILAFGTPQFFEGGGVLLRDVQVNSPDAGALTPRLRAIEKAIGARLEPAEIYTGAGETAGAVQLAQFFGRHGREVRVLRSRHLGWDDVKDAHLIFIASMRFRTRADDLGLPADFVFGPDGASAIVNRRPAPNEPAAYRHEPGADYAAVTVAPGKTPGRRVVVLGGRTTWGTQGAAEYVTRPEYLAELRVHLETCRARAGRPKHPDSYQVLLRVEVKDDQPLAVRYLTHHDF